MFSKNRDRLLTSEVAQQFFAAVNERIEGEATPLRPSTGHPFWVKRGDSAGAWMRLERCESAISCNNRGPVETRRRHYAGKDSQTVYNFTVDLNHDYFVGDEGFLVHNAGNCGPCHGNTKGKQFAELYRLIDRYGNFWKRGVSQNAFTRYSQRLLASIGGASAIRLRPSQGLLTMSHGQAASGSLDSGSDNSTTFMFTGLKGHSCEKLSKGGPSMSRSWRLEILPSYLGMGVPASVLAECTRLNDSFARHCQGPYDPDGTTLGLGLFLEGRFGKPFESSRIKLEPSKGAMYGCIYLKNDVWDLPLADYRRNLWSNVRQALLACADKLRKQKVAFDIGDLSRDLSAVEVEFLGSDSAAQGASLPPIRKSMTLDEHTEERERRVVIQFQIEGHGTARDHDKRVMVEKFLGEFLDESGLGYCDGGDIGSGTMNVFCFVKPDDNATRAIVETMIKNDFLNGAVIAETVAGEEKVVWPPGFLGEFSPIDP